MDARGVQFPAASPMKRVDIDLMRAFCPIVDGYRLEFCAADLRPESASAPHAWYSLKNDENRRCEVMLVLHREGSEVTVYNYRRSNRSKSASDVSWFIYDITDPQTDLDEIPLKIQEMLS